jgi:hypothetical protein
MNQPAPSLESFSRNGFLIAGRLFKAAAGLFLLLTISACLTGNTPKEVSQSSEAAERNQDSLAIDVENYTWTFFNYGQHIRITGRVVNNSDEPYQAVTMSLVLYDDKTNKIVAKGRAFIYPTYLKPGGTGEFEFVDMPSAATLTKSRLVTEAKTL